MNDHPEIAQLLREIQANQQSLHEDIIGVVDRLIRLETVINELIADHGRPTPVNEHQQYLTARMIVVTTGKASTSMLQRVLQIGYSKAAGLMDALEAEGVISPANGVTPREILIDYDTLMDMEGANGEEKGPTTEENDELYEAAKTTVIEAGKASTSFLQRRLRIGYTRAARLMDTLEENGVIGPKQGAKPQEVTPE